MGPQGSGKGTQADLLSKKFGIPHIDGGQLLREQVARKTAIGRRIAAVLRRGGLVPSGVIDNIIRRRLAKPDCRKGFVLDGYPREVEEAEFLDRIAKLDRVVVLDIPDSLAVKRLSARRVCIGCPVPLYGLPKIIGRKCAKCGGRLVQRDDDKPKAVRRRLQLYHKETVPVIEHYERLGIVRRVDASKSIPVVFKEVLKALSR